MADAATPVSISASSVKAMSSQMFDIMGVQVNGAALAIGFAFLGILFLFWRIQKAGTLDFADMITKDGRSVSLTKVLQLLGGVTGTWVIIKLTLHGGISEGILGLYLTYVGAIEGWSKFVSAKYGYNEASVKDAKKVE
jgi:uncharacterized membrane protein